MRRARSSGTTACGPGSGPPPMLPPGIDQRVRGRRPVSSNAASPWPTSRNVTRSSSVGERVSQRPLAQPDDTRGQRTPMARRTRERVEQQRAPPRPRRRPPAQAVSGGTARGRIEARAEARRRHEGAAGQLEQPGPTARASARPTQVDAHVCGSQRHQRRAERQQRHVGEQRRRATSGRSTAARTAQSRAMRAGSRAPHGFARHAPRAVPAPCARESAARRWPAPTARSPGAAHRAARAARARPPRSADTESARRALAERDDQEHQRAGPRGAHGARRRAAQAVRSAARAARRAPPRRAAPRSTSASGVRSHSQRARAATSAPTSTVTCMPDTASTCDTPALRMASLRSRIDGRAFAEQQRARDAGVRRAQACAAASTIARRRVRADPPIEPAQRVDAGLDCRLHEARARPGAVGPAPRPGRDCGRRTRGRSVARARSVRAAAAAPRRWPPPAGVPGATQPRRLELAAARAAGLATSSRGRHSRCGSTATRQACEPAGASARLTSRARRRRRAASAPRARRRSPAETHASSQTRYDAPSSEAERCRRPARAASGTGRIEARASPWPSASCSRAAGGEQGERSCQARVRRSGAAAQDQCFATVRRTALAKVPADRRQATALTATKTRTR